MPGTVLEKSKREETHSNGSGDIQEVFVETIYSIAVQIFDKSIVMDISQSQYDAIEVGDKITPTKEVSTLERKRLYFISVFTRKSLFYTSHVETYYL